MSQRFFSQFLLPVCMLIFSSNAISNTNSLIRIATTTSTENSGLLRYLAPKFETQTGYKLHFIAVGTGKALQMGRDGDVDLMLVHAEQSEDEFVAQGHGLKRHPVMYNDFVIVGPKDANKRFIDKSNIGEVLADIATAEQKFISRGDDSGTHKKEISLWKNNYHLPKSKQDAWYIEAGQGMGKVLQMAGELDAYTLTDRGTWLAYQDKSTLAIVFEGNPMLFNPYGMIAVNPEKFPDTNSKGAQVFINWMTSPIGQNLIGEFRISGKVLFIPNAETAAKTDEVRHAS